MITQSNVEKSTVPEKTQRELSPYVLHSSTQMPLGRASLIRSLFCPQNAARLEARRRKAATYIMYSSGETTLNRAFFLSCFFSGRDSSMQGWRLHVRYDKPPLVKRLLVCIRRKTSSRILKSRPSALGGWQFNNCYTFGRGDLPATMRI